MAQVLSARNPAASTYLYARRLCLLWCLTLLGAANHGCKSPQTNGLGTAEHYYKEGASLGEAKQYAQALEQFNLAIKLNPEYWRGWYGKAAVLLSLEQYEMALGCIERAIRLEGENADAWQVKGAILTHLEKYEEAHQALDFSNELAQGLVPNTWFAKGGAFAKAGRYEEAIDCFDRTISLDALHNKAWYNKGIALSKLSKKEDALKLP